MSFLLDFRTWCAVVPARAARAGERLRERARFLQYSKVGGWGWTPQVPRPGIQAQHPAPAPHARHDRSMARNFWWLRRKLAKIPSHRTNQKIRPELWASCGTVLVRFSKEKQWFLGDPIVFWFESLSKNNGFVNFMIIQYFKMLINHMNFNHFAISSCGHGESMFESRYTNKGLVNSWFIQYFKMSIKPMENQWISICNEFESEPNRDPVLQDQKVLPEVRNRLLLLRFFFNNSTFQNSFLIQ